MHTGNAAPAPSDRLRDVYEQRAALDYAAPADPPLPGVDRKYEVLLRLVAETLPAASLLDAGCGDGRHLAAIARLPNRPPRLAGTDISARILETAALSLRRAAAAAELVQANLERLPFADDEFERVLSVQVIEHLLDPARGVRELARVLAPGGTLVISTDNARNVISKALNAPRRLAVQALRLNGHRANVTFPHRAFSVDEFAELVGAAGLDVDRVETFRIHVDGLGGVAARRLLSRVDAALPRHRMGDIVAVVASKRAVPQVATAAANAR